jgi:hypothetical protein
LIAAITGCGVRAIAFQFGTALQDLDGAGVHKLPEVGPCGERLLVAGQHDRARGRIVM